MFRMVDQVVHFEGIIDHIKKLDRRPVLIIGDNPLCSFITRIGGSYDGLEFSTLRAGIGEKLICLQI